MDLSQPDLDSMFFPNDRPDHAAAHEPSQSDGFAAASDTSSVSSSALNPTAFQMQILLIISRIHKFLVREAAVLASGSFMGPTLGNLSIERMQLDMELKQWASQVEPRILLCTTSMCQEPHAQRSSHGATLLSLQSSTRIASNCIFPTLHGWLISDCTACSCPTHRFPWPSSRHARSTTSSSCTWCTTRSFSTRRRSCTTASFLQPRSSGWLA
ncbi:hypothetical protein BC831DRAFT_288300 [Entophlyctis helioformis]|nr:hypothetical protein BC831DRAFT_288300 [Entophlyctis helioformis]